MNAITNPKLIDFHLGHGGDHKGRLISDLWRMPCAWLEQSHDYIQWLFPTPEPSKFNPFAPLLTPQVQEAFAQHTQMQQHQLRSLDLMLELYGISRDEGVITASSELNTARKMWLKSTSHHHLRITRIIRSLALCHQGELASALLRCVTGMARADGAVSDKGIGYWQWASAPGM